MKLVIAEKSSVAQCIAGVLGATKKEKSYFVGNDYYVTWCHGHLIAECMPEEYDASMAKWALSALPFIPTEWRYKTIPSGTAQFNSIKFLMDKPDVESIICATDADREGELIFRLVYNYAECTKPFERLWLNSVEDSAIQKAFSNLRPGSECESIYRAADARAKADYLVGINATRAYSLVYHAVLNIGRVQTPTVNMIVKRQAEIDTFSAAVYYSIVATSGSIKAYTRVETEAEAQHISAATTDGIPIVTKLESEEKSDAAPALYNLATFQKDANKIFGFTAAQTLEYIQSLYEKKLLSYPRTDSRYLPSDMISTMPVIIDKIVSANIIDTLTACDYDTKTLSIQNIINDKKVSAHHAIIPTVTASSITPSQFAALTVNEQCILKMAIRQLLIAVMPPFTYTATQFTLDINNEAFSGTGRNIHDYGWLKLSNTFKLTDTSDDEAPDEEYSQLPELTENQKLQAASVTYQKKKKQPPKPYNDSTLITAMENAGRLVEDAELKSAMPGGIGTEATRAGIIERIIKTEYVKRDKRNLIPTEKAIKLMELLPSTIKDPTMTAEWEFKLEQISNNELDASQFISEIEEYTTQLVETCIPLFAESTAAAASMFTQPKNIIGMCPRCGSPVYEGKSNFYCSAYKNADKPCTFTLWKNDNFFATSKKTITPAIATALLTKGQIIVKGLISKKTGKSYDAVVILDDNGQYANFKLSFDLPVPKTAKKGK